MKLEIRIVFCYFWVVVRLDLFFRDRVGSVLTLGSLVHSRVLCVCMFYRCNTLWLGCFTRWQCRVRSGFHILCS